jgi:hypothetical protein
MALEPLWTGSELLRKLLDDFLSGKLKTETFCRDVEDNDATDHAALTPAEQPIFEKLFDTWFGIRPSQRSAPSFRSN